MTKPTGRPRGRPKTKEYVTLMARVDIALANQVKRYASLHRQPVSVVMRDALILLMEEYPCTGDHAGPQRLAAHEFLSDRYESPLDMLLGETESAELDTLLSDTNADMVDAMLSDTSGEDEYMSDVKGATTAMTSDDKRGSIATSPETPVQGRSQKALGWKTADKNVSDKKAANPSITSDRKEEARSIMSDTKGATTASLPASPAPAFMSDTNIPAYDTTKHYLGKLCPRRHDYHSTGQSLLRKTNHLCLACDREQAKERRQAKHTPARA
jgi:hypothetical protein